MASVRTSEAGVALIPRKYSMVTHLKRNNVYNSVKDIFAEFETKT
jgi:hypothetical protein